MSTKRGSISIFLAVTFLCLIVFVMSIVEVTRYQILKAQAERMVISATQSVLAGYDSALKNEYGIFARNPDYGDWLFVMPENELTAGNAMAQDFKYYLTENARQDIEGMDFSLVDRVVYGRQGQYYYDMAPFESGYTYLYTSRSLVSTSPEGLDYVKNELTEYMAARLPMMALKPVLEAFDAAEKLGRTTAFLEGKNEQTEKAADIEGLYMDLYRYIDGVTVEKSSGAVTVEDMNFVNRLRVGDGLAGGGSYEHLPENVTTQPVDRVFVELEDFKSQFAQIKTEVGGLRGLLTSYSALEEAIEEVREDIDDLEEDIDDLEDDLDDVNDDIDDCYDYFGNLKDGKASELSSLKAKISGIKGKISDKEKVLSGLEEDLDDLKEDIEAVETEVADSLDKIDDHQQAIDSHKSNIAMLTEGNDSYLDITQQALMAAEDISEMGTGLSEDIDTFLTQNSNADGSVIAGTYEQSVEELEMLQNSYSPDADGYALHNNMKRISESLEGNVALLLNVSQEVSAVTQGYPKYLIGLFEEEGIGKSELKALMAIGDSDWAFYENHLKSDSWIYSEPPDKIHQALQMIQEGLQGYAGGEFFEYPVSIQYAGEAEKTAGGIIDVMEGFVDNFSMNETFDNYVPERVVLPSGLISESFSTGVQAVAGLSTGNYDVAGSGTGEASVDTGYYMSEASEAGHILSVSYENAREQLLVNEYAVGMFRSFPDKQRTGAETLAGYSKLDHSYETELEYIYTGITDSKTALQNVVMKIFALRVAFNAVHLAGNGTKRAIITNLATTLAGWWTAGIGAVILGLVIGMLWATAESLYDIRRLLEGETVPLLKTGSSWYTDLDGLAGIVSGELTEAVVAAGSSAFDTMSAEAIILLEDLETRVEEGAADLVDEQTGALFAQVDQMTSMLVDDFDYAFHDALDQVLDSYQNGAAMVTAADYLEPGTPGYRLLDDTIRLLKESLDGQADITYNQLVAAKQEVLEAVEGRYEDVKALLVREIAVGATDTIHLGFERLNSELEAYADRNTKASEAFIRKQMENISSDISDWAKEAKGNVAPEKSTLDPTMMVPGVSYEMYLRLFMLMDYQGLDDRVVRMLDLMDYNLAGQRLGDSVSVTSEDLVLKDYAIEVTGGAEYSLSYMFIDLPLAAFKKNLWDSHYTVKPEVVNAYE